MNFIKLLSLAFLLGTFSCYSQKSKDVNYLISDTGINSELNEIGACLFKNKYIILSNKKRRHAEVTTNLITDQPNNNLYCVDIKENGDLSFPLLFSQTLDSKKDEGSIGFSADQRTIYFTQENPDKNQIYTLHKADLNEEDPKKWVNITNLNVVPAEYSVETPSLSADGKKIYVTANIAGGFGGFDIYEAPILADGTIGKLVNLGANVNTSADEKYPFISADGKYLYFSSKGHTSIGGYDFFRSSIVKNNYLPALNLGTDLNSKRDDIAFIMTSPSKGYISTDKHEQGNFDILKFEIIKQDNLSQTYIIVEEKSSIVLPNADVVITDEFGEIVSKTKSDAKGQINLDLEPLTQYTITLNKDGYETKIGNLNSADTNKNIALKQKKAVITEDAIVIENIYFDFEKETFKQESTLSLDKIFEFLNNNLEISISINAHTDSKGSEDYNQKLSEKRAKSTYQYLINKGIVASRLSYKGYGESQQLNKCERCTDEEDQTNRRVEFKIIK